MKKSLQAAVTASVFGLAAACVTADDLMAQEEVGTALPTSEAEARPLPAPPEVIADGAMADPHAAGMHDEPLPPLPAEADLTGTYIGTDGQENGQVLIVETPTGLLIRAEVTGVEHGFHGMHLHETGLCEPEQGFKTAGGHANPTNAQHGFLVEGGSHAGDFPNAYAHQEGHIRTDLFKEGVSLADLQDGDGFAVMVHSGADDYESQPSGDAGSRVACAAFPGPV